MKIFINGRAKRDLKRHILFMLDINLGPFPKLHIRILCSSFEIAMIKLQKKIEPKSYFCCLKQWFLLFFQREKNWYAICFLIRFFFKVNNNRYTVKSWEHCNILKTRKQQTNYLHMVKITLLLQTFETQIVLVAKIVQTERNVYEFMIRLRFT